MKEKITSSENRKSLKYRGDTCLNCGTPLEISDRYCSYCGQLNTTKRLTVFDYFNELFMSIITFDSRIFYTVKDLFLKPGTITYNYIKGKRTRYANPFRFFLSVSIIYFLLNGLLNFITPNTFDTYAFDRDEDIKGLNINDSITSKNALYSVIIDSILKNRNTKSESGYTYVKEESLDTLNFSNGTFKRVMLFHEFYKTTSIKDPKKALDSLHYAQSNYNRWLYGRNETLDRIKADFSGFSNFLIVKIPFFLFFFAPIFALFFLLIYFKWYPFATIRKNIESAQNPVSRYLNSKNTGFHTFLKNVITLPVWLFTQKRKVNYMEHIIFIFHIFTFNFLGLLLLLIPEFIIGDKLLSGIFFLVASFYFYKALRNFYKESRLLTLFKFFVLNFVFFSFGSILVLLFFTVTASIY